jgi:cysteine dioxygenase
MKILKGNLREVLYQSPDPAGDDAPRPMKTNVYTENEVTYISDKIGLHKIENVSSTESAVSLHLYTPPHAHNYGFNLFDEKSGKKFHIKNAPLYSDHGKLCAASL